MKIIVGLGNPGEELKNTRHNLGFMLVEKLAQDKNKWVNKEKFRAEICQIKDMVLVKPQTFMNDSGKAVVKIAGFYKVKPEDICLVHDDLDLELGDYKIQLAKGPKKHNGVLSVEKELGTKDFWRVRMGIAKNPAEKKECQLSGKDYVLSEFNQKEKEILAKAIEKATDQLLQDIKMRDTKNAAK